MSSTAEIQKRVEAFFKDALDAKVAPDFQWAVFDKDSTLASGAVGHGELPDDASGSGGKPVTEDTLYWIASCGKFGVAVMTLHVLERGLSKDGSALSDLDDPSAVLRLLPELSPDSDAWASKILEGYEAKPDPATGKLVPIVRKKKAAPTFRQLLSHTSGVAYPWSSELHDKWARGDPSINAAPLGVLPWVTGKISDFDMPSKYDTGESYEYGTGLDWLALWLVRATGKTLPQLHEEIIFKPLGMSDQAFVYVDEAHQSQKSNMYARNGAGGFVAIPFDIWSCDGVPPEGHNHFGSAPVWTTHRTYSKLYQAALRQDERLLSPATWQEALSDQITRFNVKVAPPLIGTHSLDIIGPLEKELSPGANETPTLLSVVRSTTVAKSGKPANTWSWLGLANSYYCFVDPSETANGKGAGYMFGVHLLPGVQPELFKLRDELESLLFKELKVHQRG